MKLSQSVVDYIDSLNTTKENRSTLEYLFQSELIMQRFKKSMVNNDGEAFFAMCDIIETLMAEQNVTLEEFLLAYNRDSVEAIQLLFMRPLDMSVMEIIKKHDITPQEIYDKHMRNRMLPATRVVDQIIGDKKRSGNKRVC